MMTGSGRGKPPMSKLLPYQVKLSLSSATGWPSVYHFARPRADTIMPSVAMKGGILVLAMIVPLIEPSPSPSKRPATIVQIGLESTNQERPNRAYSGCRKTARVLVEVCAKLAATIAPKPTTDPDERSTPAVMI